MTQKQKFFPLISSPKEEFQRVKYCLVARDPLDALFVTRLGSFKSSVLTENGSEQVTDFHMSGEVLGAETIPNRISHLHRHGPRGQ